MRTNYYEWKEAFVDELSYQFDKFNYFLAKHNDEPADYDTFCLFIYKNTKKRKHPYLDKLIAPV